MTDAAEAQSIVPAGGDGVIEARQLSRWYGDVIAVNDLTFDIRPGITGLLGPNGAGKTTFIRMVVGLAKPSAGSLKVLGENPWDNASLLRRIGYVPDGDAPWRDMTGRAAARFAAKLAGLSDADAVQAADAALGKVHLEDAADRVVETYSRGMRQRLKFALALLHNPDFLILDEPLLGTDPPTRRDLIQLIQAMAREGKSILVSTHILPDVEAMTDRIALVNHGRLMAHGTVSEIRDLLERYPRTVRIGTPKPGEMGEAVWQLPSVLTLTREETGLIVLTREPQVFFEQLQKMLESRTDLAFTSVVNLDENVEAIFRYLVSDR